MPDVRGWMARVDAGIAGGPYTDAWESIERWRVPEWYKDAKFGIFIHWGVYSAANWGEWYARRMHEPDTDEYWRHIARWGPHDRFGYKDFVPLFKAERFDPAAWSSLFRRAGARYVMPVAEHHDGFQMHASDLSEWNAAAMGPRRDVLAELSHAVQRDGMVFCASSHRAEHWWFLGPGRLIPSDVGDPRYASLYGPARPQTLAPDKEFLDDWLARTCEFTERYRPRIVWFDWCVQDPAFAPYMRRFAAWYYNQAVQWGCEVAVNAKYDAMPPDCGVFDIERGQLADIRYPFWQTDTAVQKKSWGCHERQEYRTLRSIVEDLVDIVSKNGALLLNIGPRGDGSIPEEEVALLEGVGRWLAVNGEAIYGTRPWKRFGEGPTAVKEGAFQEHARAPFTARDIRYTRKGDRLYATCFGWPENGVLDLPMLAANRLFAPQHVEQVDLLGGPEKLRFNRDRANGLQVHLPEKPRQTDLDIYSFRLVTR